jgi:phosphoglycolate phosphatase-like HAD superfamily hydrolase
VTGILDGIELVVFDKDGTLIEFSAMWAGWATDLAHRLEDATGLSLGGSLFAMLGFQPATGRILPEGGLAATPMGRLRERTRDVVVEAGCTVAAAEAAMAVAWHAPDPVALAKPVADLGRLFAGLEARGIRIAVATSDDREPTERTLDALGLTPWVEAAVCADDGVDGKPSPGMVLHLCRVLSVPPNRTAVVGDSPADMAMGRSAGAGRVIGVLSGVSDAVDLAPPADLVLDSVADLLAD